MRRPPESTGKDFTSTKMWNMKKALISALSVASALAVFQSQDAFAQVEILKLQLQDRIEREIAAGETHEYRIDLRRGQFLLAIVEQSNIDVVVRVRDPAGNMLQQFDDTGRAPENVTFFPEQSGEHTIEIVPFRGDAEPRLYAIAIARLEPSAKTKSGRVDQLLSPWDRDDAPGMAIAVVQDGEVIYKRGFGLAQLEYAIPITPSTVFHIESDSKQFTAYAVAMLAQQRKLSLDDDIRMHLPYLPDFSETITIRNLIHHTSGLRDQFALLGLAGWPLDGNITNDQVLSLVKRQRKLNFSPGDEFLYCNTGYTLLAEIVAAVTGQPFSEWTAENIFRPLGMTNTHFHDDHLLIVPNRAYAYLNRPDGAFQKSVLNQSTVGATGVFTTVEDMALWVRNLDEARLGGPPLLELMHTRGVLNNGDTLSYAFGLGIGQHKGLRTVGHGGGAWGFKSYVVRYPEERFALVILSNLGSVWPTLIANRVSDMYLSDSMLADEPGHEMSSDEEPDSVVLEATHIESWAPDAAELTEYVGEYSSEELGTAYSISVRDSILVATHILRDPIALTPDTRDTFVSSDTFYFSVAKFERNENGEIVAFRVSGGGVRNLFFAKR